MIKKLLLAGILFFAFQSLASAQQFSYKPISPFFGGDTFNYQQILSSAQSQNGLTDNRGGQADPRSALERFGDNINNQIFNQLARTLTAQQLEQLGDFSEPGTFTAGTLAIEIFESPEGLVINILDTTSGEETQVIIPN